MFELAQRSFKDLHVVNPSVSDSDEETKGGSQLPVIEADDEDKEDVQNKVSKAGESYITKVVNYFTQKSVVP